MKLFSILIICAIFLTGCGEFSGNHYLFYGTITNKQERIKYIEIEENTYDTKKYGNEDTYKLLENTDSSKDKNTYSTKTKKVKAVREFTYTIKLRDGRIVTITQDYDDGPILSVNQKVAVHYYPSGSGKVIPISYNSSNGSGRVIVPYGSTGDSMVIEV